MGSSLNAKKKNSKRDEILNTTYPDDKHHRNLIEYQNFWKEHLFIKGNKILLKLIKNLPLNLKLILLYLRNIEIRFQNMNQKMML